MNAGFQCGARSLHRRAFYDAITGPTVFISIVNSVKMVYIPHLKEGKSFCILLLLLYLTSSPMFHQDILNSDLHEQLFIIFIFV